MCTSRAHARMPPTASSFLMVPSLTPAWVRSLVMTISTSLTSSSVRVTFPPLFSRDGVCTSTRSFAATPASRVARSFSQHAWSTSCSRSAIWVSLRATLARWSVHLYTCETVEFSAGPLVLHEGAAGGAKGIQLGDHVLGGWRRNLVDALLSFSYRLRCLVLAFSEHACPRGFSNDGENPNACRIPQGE